MLLAIDNNDPCSPTFQMWDQHGLSSSHGFLLWIANGKFGNGGISDQVQWLVRWLRGVKQQAAASNALTFYPKLTCNFYKIQRL